MWTAILLAQQAFGSGFDVDAWWPAHATSALPSVNAGAPATGASLRTSYAHRPLVLDVPAAGPERAPLGGVTHLGTQWLVADLALSAWSSVGVRAAASVQDGPGTRPLDGRSLDTFGIRDPALGVSLTLFEVAAAMQHRVVFHGFFRAPLGDRANWMSSGDWSSLSSFAYDARIGGFRFAVEPGLRLQRTGEIAGSRVGPQATIGLGASQGLVTKERLSVFGEAHVRFNLVGQRETLLSNGVYVRRPVDGLSAPAEWLGGIRSAWGWLAFSLGAGTSIPVTDLDATAPRARVILSVDVSPRTAR